MDDFSNKTIVELERLYRKECEECKRVEFNCVKDKLSWESACEVMRPYAMRMFEIDQEIRLKMSPELTYGREWKGRLITIDEFIKLSKNGIIDDSSCRAYYATSNAKSNIRIYVADTTNNKTRNDFSHVILIN